MGLFSRFEKRVEDGFEGAADKFFDAPISPVQISKKAEKAMRREKMVGAGRQYAPTLYTVLVNPQDDQRLFGYYPTLAGETETYLSAKAAEAGLLMDGQPLVRFIVDDDLKRGKFDVIAELVAAPIISQLRQEELQRYGIVGGSYNSQPAYTPAPEPAPEVEAPYEESPYGYDNDEFPYVPEEEIDRSINYGEYTFDSEHFDDYAGGYQPAPAPAPEPAPAPAPASVGVAMGAMSAIPDPSFNDQQDYQPAQVFISPNARLTNISSNQIYDLNGRPVVMGRGADATFPIGDIHASRVHAKLHFDQERGWIITDLNSANGTKINGRPISALVLQEGDRITIGLTNFLFTYRR